MVFQERLASFMASFCETACFCGCFVKEIATTRPETMSCLWEEYEIKIKSKEKFRGRVFLHFFTIYLGNIKMSCRKLIEESYAAKCSTGPTTCISG